MNTQQDNTHTASNAQLGSMAGLVGVVTGAGTPHGIGRELVKRLAEAGALAVYACDLNVSAIPSLQQEIREAGHSTIIQGVVLDVADAERTAAIVRDITSTHKRFDFYYANAGFANYRSVSRTHHSHMLWTYFAPLPDLPELTVIK
jgi:NAD(P)-dependent dehydrogenase (short-subunit alcohol dehydrogenase family)